MRGKRIEADWQGIRDSVVAGMTSAEASKRWNVSAAAIRKRASREKWPTPTAVENRMKEIKQQRQTLAKPDNSKALVTVSSQPLEVVPEDNVTPVTVLDALAESWVKKGEKHRELAFRIATKALQELEATGTPLPCDWMSIEKADKMARRAAGLENDEATKVNVSLNLVNQRILAMQQAAE